MCIHLRCLYGIFFLLRSRLLPGYSNHVNNGTYFLPSRGEVIGDLASKYTYYPLVLQEYTSDSEIIINIKLGNIMEDISKTQMDAYKDYDEALEERETQINETILWTESWNLHFQQSEQRFFKRVMNLSSSLQDLEKVKDEEHKINWSTKELESKYKDLQYLINVIQNTIAFLENEEEYSGKDIARAENKTTADDRTRVEVRNEEILEHFCSSNLSTEKTIAIDIPESFQETFRMMCGKSFEFQNPSMPIAFEEFEYFNTTCPSLNSCKNNRKPVSLKQYNTLFGCNCSKLISCLFKLPQLSLSRDCLFQSSEATCEQQSFNLSAFIVGQCPRGGMVLHAEEDVKFSEVIYFMSYNRVKQSVTVLVRLPLLLVNVQEEEWFYMRRKILNSVKKVESSRVGIINQSGIQKRHCKTTEGGKVKHQMRQKDKHPEKPFLNDSIHLSLPSECPLQSCEAECDSSSPASSVIGQRSRRGMVLHAEKDIKFSEEIDFMPFKVESSGVEIFNQSGIRKQRCKTTKHRKVKYHVLPENKSRKKAFPNESPHLSLPKDCALLSSEPACESFSLSTSMADQCPKDGVFTYAEDYLSFGEEVDFMSFEIDTYGVEISNQSRIRKRRSKAKKRGRVKRHMLLVPEEKPQEEAFHDIPLLFPAIEQRGELAQLDKFTLHLVDHILNRYTKTKKRRKVKRHVPSVSETPEKDLSIIPNLFKATQQRLEPSRPEDCPENTTWYPINGTCLPIECQQGYSPENGRCVEDD